MFYSHYLERQLGAVWALYGVDIMLFGSMTLGLLFIWATYYHRYRRWGSLWAALAVISFGCAAYIWHYYGIV